MPVVIDTRVGMPTLFPGCVTAVSAFPTLSLVSEDVGSAVLIVLLRAPTQGFVMWGALFTQVRYTCWEGSARKRNSVATALPLHSQRTTRSMAVHVHKYADVRRLPIFHPGQCRQTLFQQDKI